MQFSTGNPNLVDYTRFLVNDPSTAASTQYSTQEVKDAVNLAYFTILSRIKGWNPGVFLKTAQTNTVADQTYYSFPSDFERMKRVSVEYSQKNIATDSTASPTKLSAVDLNLLLDYRDEAADNVYVWAPRHTDFAIYPAADSGGTNSLEYTYEFKPAALSASDDEPVILPEMHHKLICIVAAMDLRVARDLDISLLKNMEAYHMQDLMRHFGLRDIEGHQQFRTSVFDGKINPISKQGRSA